MLTLWEVSFLRWRSLFSQGQLAGEIHRESCLSFRFHSRPQISPPTDFAVVDVGSTAIRFQVASVGDHTTIHVIKSKENDLHPRLSDLLYVWDDLFDSVVLF